MGTTGLYAHRRALEDIFIYCFAVQPPWSASTCLFLDTLPGLCELPFPESGTTSRLTWEATFCSWYLRMWGKFSMPWALWLYLTAALSLVGGVLSSCWFHVFYCNWVSPSVGHDQIEQRIQHCEGTDLGTLENLHSMRQLREWIWYIYSLLSLLKSAVLLHT